MKTKTQIEALESRIAPAFVGTLNLGSFAAAHLDGHTAGDNAGFSVDDAGDVNGDGNSDFIIGAPFANSGGAAGAGAAYVVFGKDGNLPGTIDLENLSATTGFKISGAISGANLGRAVTGVGDVNGDGYDDVAVGAPLANINANSGSGIAYIVFGSANPTDVTTSQISGVNGFAVFGASPGDLCGISVAGAGDVNGDGYGDVIVGASGYDVSQGPVDAGGAVVVFGHAGSFISFTNFNQVGLGSVNPGFRVTGVAMSDNAGIAVSSAGDFNGDGFDDLLIGATGAGTGGAAYVVNGGKNMPASMSLSAADLKITGVASGDGLGDAIAKAGDVNGDGFSDIILGISGSDGNGNNSGETVVVYGAKDRGPTLSALNADIRLQGIGDNLLSGTSVSTAGDFNGDGYADLLIGATHANVGPGEGYVVFGKPGAFASPVNLSTLDGTNGFKIVNNVTGDDSGFSVSTAGDINHDGYSDLLFAAPGATIGGKTDAGKTTILYGSNGGNPVNLSADGRTATYTDVDGDLVTIKVNKGTLEQNDFKLSGKNALGGSTLQLLDLTGHTDLSMANVTITAKPQIFNGTLTGDGHANLGELDATGISLGVVKINGDLGSINAGANGLLLPAVKSLNLYSLGQAREITQSPADQNDLSLVIGTIGTLKVATNVEGVRFLAGKIGVANIGGDVKDSTFFLTGESAPKTAATSVALKSLTVRGDFDHSAIRGGQFFSGNADVQLGKIAIGGDFIASSLTAGISAGTDQLLATADDAVYAGGSAAIVSRIASVVIKGQALGTNEAGGRFAIEAEQIGSVQIGTTKLALKKTVTEKMLQFGSTGDLFVHEV